MGRESDATKHGKCKRPPEDLLKTLGMEDADDGTIGAQTQSDQPSQTATKLKFALSPQCWPIPVKPTSTHCIVYLLLSVQCSDTATTHTSFTYSAECLSPLTHEPYNLATALWWHLKQRPWKIVAISRRRLWPGNSNSYECHTEPREVFSTTRPPNLRESLNTLTYWYLASDTEKRFPMKSVKSQ